MSGMYMGTPSYGNRWVKDADLKEYVQDLIRKFHNSSVAKDYQVAPAASYARMRMLDIMLPSEDERIYTTIVTPDKGEAWFYVVKIKLKNTSAVIRRYAFDTEVRHESHDSFHTVEIKQEVSKGE